MSDLALFMWGFVVGAIPWGIAGYYLRYKSCRAGRTCSGLVEEQR